MYGFHVTAITGDGAAENRSVFRRLCTHTVLDVLKAATVAKYDWIPTDMKISFTHPIVKGRYVGGDFLV